ncbi:MAG: phospholipase D family protein [Woeseiaceae bacterium]
MKGLLRTAGLLASMLLAACTSVDFDYPKTESFVLPSVEDTYLGVHLADVVVDKPADYLGFYPLSDGVDAFAARLLLIDRAERSIDVQYYLIKTDLVGNTFVHALLRAADRGVRVRLLLDDIMTGGYDAGMAALDSHPNFEMRVFNPFNRGAAGRTLGALGSFSRINRRMHNKSVTVDNHMTIIGGRNMANHYFGAEEDKKYGDLDVIGIGPVVNDVSMMFDEYWNHHSSLPVQAVAKPLEDPAAELARVRKALDLADDEIADSVYAKVVEERYYGYVHSDDSIFEWSPYEFVYDSPDKVDKKKAGEAPSITTGLAQSLRSAEDEIIIVSPYFVPRKGGIETISKTQESGIDVTIITNSLAANNQFSVHAGYAPSRKPLLENGVKMYEMRPDADVSGAEFVAYSGARATLHTKAFIVDRKSVFIGSFNFDPRSININTEMGVIIHDPQLAKIYADAIDAALPDQTYEVFLNEKNKVRWRTFVDGQEQIFEKEPETTWGDRFKVGFVRILPIRGQL